MQNQELRDGDDDDKSVEICLDTLTVTQSPPTPKAEEPTEKRRASSPRPIFPQQGGVTGYSMRQLLNEKALEIYSDDDSVYLKDDDEMRGPPIQMDNKLSESRIMV